MYEALVFLTEQAPPWSGLLADVLEQHQIPFFTVSALGAGMVLEVGPMLERIAFSVPASRWTEAKALVDELFSGEPAIEP